MGLKEDLDAEVARIFRLRWDTQDTETVPAPEDVRLSSNHALKLEGTVLYADMAHSTKLVNAKTAEFAAEVYKTYLHCAAKTIKDNDGSITAYDGDRVMAVFVGGSKNTNAAITALKLNYAVTKIINPALEKQYPTESYRLAHKVGIDTSSLFIARTGVRIDNDLVWVGRAANYAAKLASIEEANTAFITEAVFTRLKDEAKYGGTGRELMWKERRWSQNNNERIYSSTWTWTV